CGQSATVWPAKGRLRPRFVVKLAGSSCPGGELQGSKARLPRSVDRFLVDTLSHTASSRLAASTPNARMTVVGPVASVSGPPVAISDTHCCTNSLVLPVFYQRAGRWRFRAVGQGYEETLAGFAVRDGGRRRPITGA